MKIALFGGIALVAVALSVPTNAQPDASHTFSVVAPAEGARIRTYGPDAAGRYMLRINIADLDLASDAGWRTMEARVARGSATLCDVAADQPQVAGYYNRGARQCVSETSADARAAMTQARDAARQGRSVATLGLSRPAAG